jgi:hypothetical protein
MRNALILPFLLLFIPGAFSQEQSQSDTLRKDALNVYMDATSYIKQEIPFINYVRDRKVADLVIISAYEPTGSGGGKATFYLEGQGSYKGMNDTIHYNSYPDDTNDMSRQKEVKTLKMGLMRYIMKTPLAKYIDINFSEPITEDVSSDKWNNWVFRTRVNGFGFCSESSDYLSLSGNISANRVTSEWKMGLSAHTNMNIRQFRWIDDDTGEELSETNRRKSFNFDGYIVKSLGEHWSAGINSSFSGSLFSNYMAHFELKPGVEYNIFPYSESTSKQFRILYLVGPVYNNYYDTTKYFRKNEFIGQQSLVASYMIIKKWGDISLDVSWDNYLHDFNLNRLTISGYVSLQVIKGLKIDFGGSYAFIHDQINLRKGSASTEDVLLSRREMSTTYSYDVSVGISYTFGSIYNNVVNPRFNRRGGDMIIIF